MSGCNQCLKVPCECMDNPAELLRSEFPGWSVEGEGETSWWTVSWAEDIREQYEAAKAKHAAFQWSYEMWFTDKTTTVRARAEHMHLTFTKAADRPWQGMVLGIDVSATTLEEAFVKVMDACRRGDDNRSRPLAPSAEALRAKGAAEVRERDFHKLTAILEKHVADLRAAFPDRTWSFSVGMDLAASCIHENEFGDAPSYIQWRDGWFAGTEDGPETKTYTTPVEAFRALLAQPQHAAPRQVRPAHHGGTDNPYECIKVIRAWGLNFELGNVAKYLSRAGKKPGVDAVDDLRKLITYAEMEIERREADRGN